MWRAVFRSTRELPGATGSYRELILYTLTSLLIGNCTRKASASMPKSMGEHAKSIRIAHSADSLCDAFGLYPAHPMIAIGRASDGMATYDQKMMAGIEWPPILRSWW